MIIPAVALKVVGGAFLAGTVVSSIAVPTALSLNSSSQISFNRFKELQADKYKGKCQWLIKDDSEGQGSEKYLLVCKQESGEKLTPEFYFYKEGDEPIKVKELKEQKEKGDKSLEVTVVLDVQIGNTTYLTTSSGDWTKLIDKDLNSCSLTSTNDVESSKSWTLHCSGGDSSDSTNISLTPITY